MLNTFINESRLSAIFLAPHIEYGLVWKFGYDEGIIPSNAEVTRILSRYTSHIPIPNPNLEVTQLNMRKNNIVNGIEFVFTIAFTWQGLAEKYHPSDFTRPITSSLRTFMQTTHDEMVVFLTGNPGEVSNNLEANLPPTPSYVDVMNNLRNAKDKVVEIGQDIRATHDKVAGLDAQMTSIDSQISALEDELKQPNADIADLAVQYDNLMTAVNEIHSAMDNINTQKIIAYRTRITELRAILQSLNEQIKALSLSDDTQAQMLAIQSQADGIANELQAMDAEIKNLSGKTANMQGKLHNLATGKTAALPFNFESLKPYLIYGGIAFVVMLLLLR